MKPTSQAEWDELLKSEGMPDELPASRRQALGQVHPETVDGSGLASSASYQHWTAMTHAAYALPRNWKGRAFVLAYVETGYISTACASAGITRIAGLAVLKRFAKTMKGRHDQSE
jgi:hypothetical protein